MNQTIEPSKEKNTPSHVVGIGASAGGLEALQEFFENLSNDTGAAYIVVQHLSPDYKSMMSELLAKNTEMPIFEVRDSIDVEANAIYLVPPRKNMLITEGKLLLSDQMPDRHPHLSIDVFLRSLAEDQQHKGIGIVLSGTGTDGTRGIRAMKEAGGLVVVQKPDSAKFDGMPKSAYNTGLADMVLAPHEMGENLVNFMNHPSIKGDSPVISYATSDGDSDTLAEIFQILKKQSSINFSQYKPSTVSRRIDRRLGINQLTSLDAYLRLLMESPREVQILSKELLINVTRFFRDDEAFDKLTTDVIHKVLTSGDGKSAIRLWIAGCSSGEEAYSIAILFDEIKEQYQINRQVKIFATDVDEDAIAEASTGIYTAEIVQDITPKRLTQYFESLGENYTVSPKLRQMVIFAQHNMIEDPPFSNINLLSCRNALIYFQQSAQQKVFTSFYFALQQEGFLFLGNSESLGDMSSHFEIVDERNKIFQKVSSARIPLKTVSTVKHNPTSFPTLTNYAHNTNQQTKVVISNKYNSIMERLIEHYAPDIIVLNDNFEAIHVYGDVSNYTKGLTRGKVSTQIKDMICDDLAIAVSTALYRCEKSEDDVFYNDVTHFVAGESQSIDLAVFVVKQSEHQSSPRSYVLQFIKHTDDGMVRKIPKSITFDASEQSQQRIYDLEQELIKKQEHLQVTIEELETTNEELQSANEELMSSNEELQSTNEELQSVNEELYTVNSEYQEKILQLTEANVDLDSVINSTDIGIVFLDEHLTIRKYTPHAAHYINLRNADIGRPIHHISHELDYNEFLTEIANVSTKGVAIEKDILTNSGEAVLLRLIPYSYDEQAGQYNQGVLITITNISRLKFIENALKQSQQQFKSLLINRSERLEHRIEKIKQVTVLLIDDDSIDRLRVNRLLKEPKNRKYTILEAPTLDEANKLIESNNVDVCLLDYQLAGNTAEDFTKIMKDKNIDIPIILLSGQSESIMNEDFLENEIFDVIDKEDLSRLLLVRIIDYTLERQQIKNIVQNFEI